MNEDTDRFVFPDMPDEAVVAIDHFLEAFYHRFQNHYFAQMHSITTIPCRPARFPIHHSDSLTMTAAMTPRSRSPMAHHRS